MPDYLVIFAASPVDDDTASAIVERVRSCAGAGWFDDPAAATPADRTCGGYVRVEAPEDADGERLLAIARELSAAHGIVVEVQWREEVVGHLEAGDWRAA